MILEFDLKTVGHRGRPQRRHLEVASVEEAQNFVKATLKRTKKSQPQLVVSNITIKSKALSK